MPFYKDKYSDTTEVSPGLFCTTGGTLLFKSVGRTYRFKSRNPEVKVRQDLSRPRRAMSRRDKTLNHWARLERLRRGRPEFYYNTEKYKYCRIVKKTVVSAIIHAT